MARHIEAILFDLDNTLYDARAGLQEVGDRRITAWIMENIGLPHDEADALRVRTWREYGTTARGLEIEYGASQQDMYEVAIGRIDPAEHLEPWPQLREMLTGLDAHRHVFTNAPAVYARKVLAALGIEDLFGWVFDIEHNRFICKPNREIYELAVADVGLPAERIAFVEDNASNLAPAAQMGMLTVLVSDEDDGACCDLRIESILQLAEALGSAGVSTSRGDGG